MIQIKKSPAGFRVLHVGANGEKLNTSEVFTSKAAVWKNIRAVMKIYSVGWVDVTTETGAIVRVREKTLEVMAQPVKKKR